MKEIIHFEQKLQEFSTAMLTFLKTGRLSGQLVINKIVI